MMLDDMLTYVILKRQQQLWSPDQDEAQEAVSGTCDSNDSLEM
jgi:hypothetical protein